MRARLYLLIFLNSFASILVTRGAFFYSQKWLNFSDPANLSLALVFGLTYVLGACLSHSLAKRLGERRALLSLAGAQLVVFLFLALPPWPTGLFLGIAAVGVLTGMTWPVVESYVMAGLTPSQARKITGRFNLSWSLSIPPALIIAGPMIHASPEMVFLAGAALGLAFGVLVWTLPAHPVHLPDDHPERPSEQEALRVHRLMVSARWQLLTSYSTLWILAAMMPSIFDRLGYGAQMGTGLSSVLDIFRIVAFAGMYYWIGWHGRIYPLAAAVVLLPVGFFLALYGGSLTQVLLGEALFGLTSGVIYCAAFYYAMVAKNASVEAGGGHEGLIGVGFAAGPAANLLSIGVAPHVGGKIVGLSPRCRTHASRLQCRRDLATRANPTYDQKTEARVDAKKKPRTLARGINGRRWDLNPRPQLYESCALPLSYVGNFLYYTRHTAHLAVVSECLLRQLSGQPSGAKTVPAD